MVLSGRPVLGLDFALFRQENASLCADIALFVHPFLKNRVEIVIFHDFSPFSLISDSQNNDVHGNPHGIVLFQRDAVFVVAHNTQRVGRIETAGRNRNHRSA